MKGLFVNVYRSYLGNCTNGASAKADRILLVGAGVPEVFEAGGSPVYELKNLPHSGVVAVPYGSGSSVSFSGNMLGTSDSRFSEACRALDSGWRGWVVPIFDRDESLPFDMTRYYFCKASLFVGEESRPVQFAFKYEPTTLMMETAVEYLVADLLFDGDDPNTMRMRMFLGRNVFLLEWGTGRASVYFDDVKPLSYHEYECLARLGVHCVDLSEADVFAWMAERADQDSLVIRTENNQGLVEYWNADANVWGGLGSATTYTRNDAYRIRPHVMPKSNGAPVAFCLKAACA